MLKLNNREVMMADLQRSDPTLAVAGRMAHASDAVYAALLALPVRRADGLVGESLREGWAFTKGPITYRCFSGVGLRHSEARHFPGSQPQGHSFASI
jgi:hypothetical protein